MIFIKELVAVAGVITLASAQLEAGVQYIEPVKPFKDTPSIQSTAKGAVKLEGGVVNIPMITWAADGVTVASNGGVSPKADSPLAKGMGMQANLELVDDFEKQIQNYVSGHSPFLRGTVGMIQLASEALTEKSPDLKPIVILQLSWSTGADGFVAKGIETIADLKGKSIVVQNAGPHVDLIQVLLQDAGLKQGDVTIKYVSEITFNEEAAKDGNAHDPANALREDASLAGAACIIPDMLALTSGGNVGTGSEDSVKGARAILSTRTANRIIADVYAVRADFFASNRKAVHGFVLSQFREQKRFQEELANITKKGSADKKRVGAFRKSCRSLSGIFLQDEAAVSDYISWVGLDLQLAGYRGNLEFFANEKNPVGFAEVSKRSMQYLQDTGALATAAALSPADWKYSEEFGTTLEGSAAPVVAKKKPAFSTPQAVRKAAAKKDASTLMTHTFTFPANVTEIRWQDHSDVFTQLHEKVARYGGAIVQLRGHADNFFYNFVVMKKKSGAKTYRQRVPGTDEFQEKKLPAAEEVTNAANQLSYSRAFAVKKAYAKYLRESLGLSQEEIDLSRFDVKGMGISDPIYAKPTTREERAENMRGEMVIIAVESEIDLDFGMDDLQ